MPAALVTYLAPLPVDVGFAQGAWLGLRWAVGNAPRPPVNTPIRTEDGVLMATTQIYAELLRRGRDRDTARREATQLAGYSRRLASLVEACADRLGS